MYSVIVISFNWVMLLSKRLLSITLPHYWLIALDFITHSPALDFITHTPVLGYVISVFFVPF